MIPGGDIIADLELNVSPAAASYSRFAQSLPPVRVPLDFGGLGPSGLGRITGNANDFSRALEASTARVVAFGLSAGSVYAIARAFREVISSAIEVQKSMAQINAIANLGSNSLSKFTTDLFNAANLTGQSWKIAADTALLFSRQGLSVNETLKRTTDALTLVRIGGLDVADSVRTLTTVLNAYNQTITDSTKITNSLLTVDTQFPIAGKDIADALTRVSSIAKDTGVSFDKLVGLITAAKTVTGREGSVIGTALGTIFQRINRPQVLDQLKELGVVVNDVNGDTLSSDQILTNLSKTYDNLSSSQQNQLAQLSGGIRQGNIFRALMQDLNRENSVAARATLVSADATDLAARRQATLNQTLAAQLNQAKNNITNVAAQGGEVVFTPVLKELTGSANKITETIGNSLNSDKNSTIGQQLGGIIGTGLLKGLGDFLAGPGLALIGTVLVRFGSTFSGYIGKAFVTLLETTTKQYQAQQALNQLFANEAGLQQKIATGALSELQIREKILQLVQQQSVLQQRLAATGNIGVGLAQRGEVSLQGGRFTNTRVFGFADDPVQDAINKERLLTGLSPDQIKVSSSEVLKTMDNPLGLGVYNTRDEPNGLNQGIQRVLKSGKGIPTFAESDVYQTESGKLLSLKKSLALQTEIKNIQEQIREREIGLNEAFEKSQQFPKKYGISSEALENIRTQRFQKTYGTLSAEATTKQSQQSFEESIGQTPQKDININTLNVPKFSNFQKEVENYANKVRKGLIDPSSEAATKLEKEFNAKAKYIEGQHYNYQGYQKQVQNVLIGASQEGGPALEKRLQQQQKELEEINQKKLAKDEALLQEARNIRSVDLEQKANQVTGFTSLLFPSNRRTLRELRGTPENPNPEGLAALTSARQAFAGRALQASFVAPIVGEIAQQGITSIFGDNLGTRRANSAIGAGSDIVSFAGIGSTFGPEGTFIGAAAGAILGIGKAITGWNDTLPELQKNLESMKESTQKTSESINGYLDVSSKLADIYSGKTTGASQGDVKRLELQQQQALLQIPDFTQRTKFGQLIKGGNFSGAYDLQSNINQQNQIATSIAELAVQTKTKGFLPSETESYGGSSTLGRGIINELFVNQNDPRKDQLSAGQKLNLRLQQAERDATIQSLAGQSSSLIFGLSSQKTGQSLFDSLKQDTGATSKLGSAKTLEDFTNSLLDIGKKAGVADLPLINLASTLDSVDKNAQPLLLEYLRQIFNPKGINDAIKRAKEYQAQVQEEETASAKLSDAIDNINSKFSDLTNKLQQTNFENFTKLIISLKNSEYAFKTQNQIGLINSGGGQYSQAFSTLNESLLGNKDKRTQDIAQAGRNFSDELSSAFDDIISKTLNATQKKLDSNKFLSGDQTQDLLDKLSNKLDATFSPLKNLKNLSPQNVNNILKTLENVHAANEEYANAAENFLSYPNIKNFTTDLGGGASGALGLAGENAFNQFSNISILGGAQGEGIIQKVRALKLKYNEGVAKSESDFGIGNAETYGKYNYDVSTYGAEFANTRLQRQNEANLQLSELQQQNRLKNQLGNGLNPFQELGIRSQLEFSQEQGNILQSLTKGPTQNLGITNTNQITGELLRATASQGIAAFKGDTGEYNHQTDIIQALTTAQDQLNAAKKKQVELDKQSTIELQKHLTFSDEQVAAIGEQNINAARSGTLTGENYKLAFESPFAYNSQTFQRDLITDASELGDLLKNTLSEGIREAGRSAKDASQFFRNLALNIGTNLAAKGSQLGLNSLFGLAGQGLGLDIGKVFGASSGGYIGMGSGTKDDVPALLTGGEFVLNKRATQNIGKSNLDMINHYDAGGIVTQPSQYLNQKLLNPHATNLSYDTVPAAITSDTISQGAGNTSVNVGLANEYVLGSVDKGQYQGIGGNTNISSALSSLGASDSLNPQNQLRLAREKYGYNRAQGYNRYKGELQNYDINQYIQLGQSYVGAAGIIGGAALNQPKVQAPGGTAQGDLQEISLGTEGYVGGISPFLSSTLTAGGTGGLSDQQLLSILTKGAGTGLGTAEKSFHSKGGYISKFSGGGYFGGDASTDTLGAMVMGGEYVVGSKTVSKYGKSYFEGLNNAGKYASGGSVSSAGYMGSGDDSSSVADTLAQIRDKLIPAQSQGGKVAQSNTSNSSINHTSNITINMSPNGGVQNTTATSSTTGGNSNNAPTQQSLNQLSTLISKQVVDVINQNSRPGGLLYNKFALNQNAQ